MNKKNFIHETSIVENRNCIGKGTRVWQFCNVMDGCSVGEDCNIGQNVFIETNVFIGSRVTIKNNISLYSGLKCEDDVFLGPNCVFTNVINPRSFISRKKEFKDTYVKQGASIGANATIICGTVIGSYSMVGAGAVVTKDVSDYALVVGNPARTIGYVCQCGTRLHYEKNYYYCPECAKKYRLVNDKLTALKSKKEEE